MVETASVVPAEQSLPAGEALLKLLRLQGIRTIFSSPGSEWPALWDALVAPERDRESPIRYVNTRHESLAVAMAGGYQKATGELTAVFLHSTVGPLQGAMAVHNARRDQIPLVILSGDAHTWGLNPSVDPGYQWLRILAETGGASRLVGPVTKWSDRVSNVWQLGEMFQQACRAALAPPCGPTYLEVPYEVMLERIPVSALPQGPLPPVRHAPDPSTLDRFADALARARRPIIVTEEAGRDPENVGRLVRLAEALGAAVIESQVPSCVNFPTNHPLHQGVQGLPVIEDADAVLLLAARGPWHVAALRDPINATVLLADEDPAKLDWPLWPYRIDDYAAGSIAATLDGLLDRIAAAGIDPAAVEERRSRWQARHRKVRQQWADEAEAARDSIPLDPRWVCKTLGELIPGDAVVTEETITTRPFIERYLPRTRPGSYLTRMMSGLGVGLSMAVGLKIAHPDRPVIAICGDGAFNYNPSVAAFGSMQEHAAPVLTIIINNHSYLAIKRGHVRAYPEGWAAKSGRWIGSPIEPAPDYALMAPVFGGHGGKVKRPEELRPAFERGLEAVRSGRLAIVDVVVSDVY